MLLDYGLEGYGLYWYCIELIAGGVDVDNITFSLEHDARIIARNTGSTAQKVEEMMRYFCNIGLFENADGAITCMKLAKRLDQSMTSNKSMRAIIDKLKEGTKQQLHTPASHSHDEVMTKSCQSHDLVMQEEIRSEEIRQEEIREDLKTPLSSSANSDALDGELVDEESDRKLAIRAVIEHLNLITGAKYKPSSKGHTDNISGRLSDGHTVEDMMLVIEHKASEWLNDAKWGRFLRPSTLFQPGKFDGYLIAARAAKYAKPKRMGDHVARSLEVAANMKWDD